MSPLARARLLQTLKWAGIILGALLLILVLILAFADWNALRGPIARYASHKLNRPVTIAGNLEVHALSLTPRLSVEGLRIGNAPSEHPDKDMVEVERLQAQVRLMPLLIGRVIVPSLVITQPVVRLHRDSAGRANWDFGAPQRKAASRSTQPLKLPLVRKFVIDAGRLEVLDEIRKLNFAGDVEATEEKESQGRFVLDGKGELNRKPFSLHMNGDPLLELQPSRPYSFELQVKAADNELQAQTAFAKPFDLNSIQSKIKLTGQDLADFYYLTGLALPNTSPFDLAAKVTRDGMHFKLEDIAGTVGNSDMGGRLAIDLSGEKPRMDGALTSKLLDLADLAAPLGAQVDKRRAEAARSAPASAFLLPEARLQVNRVRAMNADVKYEAQAIKTEKLPLRKVALHVLLKDGVLQLDPFAMELPQGKLAGTARVDATGEVPHTDLDARLTDVRLEQFVKPGGEPPLAGTLQARMKVQGTGDSVHATAAHSSGALTVIVPHGEIRKAFAELTGINVDRGLGLLLSGDQDKATVRCGITDFKIRDGVMNADTLVFDTDTVLITGKGQIRLQTEELDLSIRGQPKKLRLVRLRSPIQIGGHLRKPSVAVDVGKTAAQTGIAAALGTLLTPFAALAAFVDPGLAKDANCSALLDSAKNSEAPPKTGEAPPQSNAAPQKPAGGAHPAATTPRT